jgi:hypothetical protein
VVGKVARGQFTSRLWVERALTCRRLPIAGCLPFELGSIFHSGARKEQFMKSSNYGKAFFAILMVCLFVTISACPRVGTTSVRGVVTDKTGAAVVGAKVTLSSAAQAFRREMQTNQAGEYEFLALPPSGYALKVEKVGFRKFDQKALQLLVNLPTTVNVTLEIGTTSETIEVSASAVTLNTTDASLGIAFNENQVKELPMEGRNVPDLLSLQAGVLYTGNRLDINTDIDTRNGAVNGARSDQSNITLDVGKRLWRSRF